MKTALFVDFDNVFSGLRRLDPAYAHEFALRPSAWMKWLTDKLPLPPYVSEDRQRRILVRRCYLNPSVYQQFRFAFSKAGFEIVDCPPMTKAGKTSTDIHMVLDMVDVLQHSTHYDEFIVFSADADFSPVLRKLRRSDRRTTVLAAGETSAAYEASTDLMIDAGDFINEALGFGDQNNDNDGCEANVDTQSPELLLRAQQIVFQTINLSDDPLPLERLAQTLREQMPDLRQIGWTDEKAFKDFLDKLTLSTLVIDKDNSTISKVKHVEEIKSTIEKLDLEEGNLKPSLVEQRADDIIIQEVLRSNRPVPCSTLALVVKNRAINVRPEWNGLGSFRKFLESLELKGLQVNWSSSGGVVFDPNRHSISEDSLDEALQAREALWIQVGPVFGMSKLPALTPRKYGVLLTCLSDALQIAKFNLLETSKRVCELAIAKHEPLSRKDVDQLLRIMLFGGFNPETDNTDVESLTATVCGIGLAACSRERVEVDDSLRSAVLSWIGGEVQKIDSSYIS
jgi:hypothetical protein